MLRQDERGYVLPYRVRYPVELHPPPGFRAEDAATWPRLDGRIEFVQGRLQYRPPCGDVQQDVAADVAFLLRTWTQEHPEFSVAANEAGMTLGGETRAADVAIWRRGETGPHTGGFRRVPPVLAVEIAGQDEDEPTLRAKARWYLDRGVAIVWVVLPDKREVLVLTGESEHAAKMGSLIPDRSPLVGLSPPVAELFSQLE